MGVLDVARSVSRPGGLDPGRVVQSGASGLSILGLDDPGRSSHRGVMGAAFETLEQLRRPQAALFQGLITGSAEEGLRELVEFKQRPTFEDVLNAGGTPEFPFRGTVEFLGDVVIDPLFFIPGKAISTPIKVAGRYGHKGILRLENLGVPVTKAENGLKRLFTGASTAEGTAAKVAAAKATRAQALADVEIEKILKAREKDILRIAKETGQKPGVVRQAITAGVEAKQDGGVRLVDTIEALVEDIGGGQSPFGELIREVTGRQLKTNPELVDLEEAAREILRAEGVYDPWKAFPGLSREAREAIEPVIGGIRRRMDHISQVETKTLKGFSPLQSERLEYFTHAIHPDARRILMSKGMFNNAELGYAWSPNHASLLERQLKHVSIAEINRKAIQGKLTLLDNKKVPLFIDAPEVIEAIRLYRSTRAILSTQMLDGLIQRFGGKLDDVVGRLGKDVVSRDFSRVKVPGYKGYILPREAADIVNRHWTASTDPAAIQTFVDKVWSPVQNAWKAWTLGIFPEYHFRNAVTNVWNNFLAGMGPGQMHHYYTAAKLLKTRSSSGFPGTRLKAILGEVDEQAPTGVLTFGSLDDNVRLGRWNGSVRELLDSATEEGVFRGGIFGAELAREELALSGLERGVGHAARFLRGENVAVKGGFRVGQAVEDHARLAHFIWRISKGDTFEQAGKSVKKSLFNYDELDPFTEVGRKFIPFLTWSRFNVPYQIEHLVVDPWKASLINKFRIAVESEAHANPPVDERFVADYVRRGMGIRTRRSSDGGYDVFLLDNWVPISDLNEVGLLQAKDGIRAMAENVGPWAWGMLSPLLTVPAESITGHSVFLGRQFLPEKRRFLGMNLTEKQANALRTIRLLSVMDRFVKSPRDGEFGDAIRRTLTGLRTIRVDPSTGQRFHRGRTRAQIRELESALRRARRRGNQASVEDLQRRIAQLRREAARPQVRGR